MMLTRQFHKPEHIAALRDPAEDSPLFVHTWQEAIDRLNHEKTSLLKELPEHGDEARQKSQLRLLAIEYEVEIYEMCIDRAHERHEIKNGWPSEHRETVRSRFYHLMGSLAKAENDLSNHVQRAEFVGDISEDQNWSPNRWVDELQEAASQACHRMAHI